MRERETRRFDDSVENGSGEQRVGVVQCVDLRRGTKEGRGGFAGGLLLRFLG